MSKKIMYSYAAVAFICMILGNSVSPFLVESNQGQAVVKNWLHHQIWAFSDLIEVDSNYLHIKSAEFVHYLGEQVDYNFMMHPRGQILLPPLDELPAINLYSVPKTSSVYQGKDLPCSLKGVLLFLLLENVSGEENDFFVADYSMNNLPVWGKFSGPVDMGLLDNPDIDEVSGIVATRQDPGFLWTHNDSGDYNRIFLVRNDGTRKGTFLLEDAGNRDFEDIAAGPGPVENVNYLFVADIGDNLAMYTYKYIYRFPEPDVSIADLSDKWVEVDNVERITFVYPDGIMMDAETLMVDPWTKDIYIVTKREQPVTVYRLPYPQSTTDTIVAEKYGTLPFSYAVGGDVSLDGKEVLIKTYNEVYLWSRDEGERMCDAFMRPPFRLNYIPEPQGEAIAFALDGSGYYTLSEIRHGIMPRIYFYERKE